MSDIDGPAAGAHRIGDDERAAATAALDAHREAGRLDAVEYEERQVQVARARTWAQIQPLFRDLPQPHPAGMPAAGVVPLASPGPVAPVPAGAVDRPGDPGVLSKVVPDRYKATVMALTPFAALLLFFVTPVSGWLWFLAIPVMGILLYGTEGKDERPSRQQRRDRRRYR